jgi:hypothetical protein
MMADKPILFSAPMVRALIAGNKTQTRRVLKLRTHKSFSEFGRSETPGYDWTFRDAEKRWHDYTHADLCTRQLGFQVRDFLWVKEAFCFDAQMDGIAPSKMSHYEPRGYPANNWVIEPASMMLKTGRLRSSLHMPRWASRMTLAINEVRVQRLQDITEADAWAEGCKPGQLNDRGEPFPAEEFDPHGSRGWDCARDWYADLWEDLHGPEAWDKNPWVAAYIFTLKQVNIDQVAA